VGFLLLLYFMSWMVRPDMVRELKQPGTGEIAAVDADRDMTLNPENPPCLYREVDYSEGKSGSWYPKGESPDISVGPPTS
jgi:hypothetical protein